MGTKEDRALIEHFTKALQAIEERAQEALGTNPLVDETTTLGVIVTIASEALKSG